MPEKDSVSGKETIFLTQGRFSSLVVISTSCKFCIIFDGGIDSEI